MKPLTLLLLSFVIITACKEDDAESISTSKQSALLSQFNGAIDLDNLPNYANQLIPDYITQDNSQNNPVTDAGAVLGRVLFYDKNLSINNTVSCASCHQQRFAFGDASVTSQGVNGTTGRHSMRLINARFGEETRFFWDERASSLEDQTTQPIQDHVEMGFSGQDGDDNLDDLFEKLSAIDYYPELFAFAYGDSNIDESRIQLALAQFIRSIQSFDSKFDAGLETATNLTSDFSNFTQQENMGKSLFIERPMFNTQGVRVDGGLGCQGCHRAPEFDIDPNTGNNGIINAIGGGTDTENTRSPTLRDLFNASGIANGPFMHTGFSSDVNDVLEHYNEISTVRNGIDPRLTPGGSPQNLNMTPTEKEAIIAFIKTLSGTAVYTDERWSDPFL